MLTLRWSANALADFDAAQSYIAQENAFAAQTVADRIWQSCLRLPEAPLIGRPGIEPDTRHWVVQRTPYLIVYRVTDHAVEILRVWHSAQDWTQRTD